MTSQIVKNLVTNHERLVVFIIEKIYKLINEIYVDTDFVSFLYIFTTLPSN